MAKCLIHRFEFIKIDFLKLAIKQTILLVYTMDCETLEEIEVINLKTKTDKKPFWNCSVQQKSTQI